ncbi:MAG: GDP-L-fucose synthase [Deltaproteobacteria bacterium]|nr:GDP-L-fucose synthase [Deltaproteobacteria bacterium]
MNLAPDSKIYIAGHRGLVGSAIVRRLEKSGYHNLLTRTHHELDLTDPKVVLDFFDKERPDYVFLAAAKVGGIHANNTRPADFIRDNLFIELSIIDAAYRTGTKRLLFLGSSCIYPKIAPQPLKEEYLMTGPLEPTNSAYALAKIAGIEMCKSYNRQYGTRYLPVMPTNLYGPGDNFDLESSHVLPALIRKFHEARIGGAKTVTIWGTGTPRREFLHVDDLADACVYLMENYNGTDLINIGTGEDITIRELAEMVGVVTGFEGKLKFDPSRPDGTPRKLLDVSRLNSIGWKAGIGLAEGIRATYQWYLDQSPEE